MSTDMLAYALGGNDNPANIPGSPYQIAQQMGQGIDQGVANYQNAASHTQEMRLNAARLAQLAQQTQQEKQTFDEEQKATALAGTQAAYNMAERSGDTAGQQAASAQIPALYNAAHNTNLPIPKPVVGMPMSVPVSYGAAAQGIDANGNPTSPLDASGNPTNGVQGTDINGNPNGAPFMPRIGGGPGNNDLTNPQSQAAMGAMSMQAPIFRTDKNGEVDYMIDPTTLKSTVLNSNQQKYNPPPAGYGALSAPTPSQPVVFKRGQQVRLFSPQGGTGAVVDPNRDPGLPAALTDKYNTPTAYNSPPPTSGTTAQWSNQINTASKQTGVPPAVLHAVMRAESNGNPNAKSPVGALGLMQLMPGTAQGLGVDPSDPGQNILGGAKYLAQMKAKFGDWPSAIAAYNAGPGALAPSKQNPNYQIWQAPYNKGYQETRNYVKNITQDIQNRASTPSQAQQLAAFYDRHQIQPGAAQ